MNINNHQIKISKVQLMKHQLKIRKKMKTIQL